jgi:hypothetical protein
VEQVAGPLRAAQRFHALALLHAARSEPEQALELWRVRCHRRQDFAISCSTTSLLPNVQLGTV